MHYLYTLYDITGWQYVYMATQDIRIIYIYIFHTILIYSIYWNELEIHVKHMCSLMLFRDPSMISKLQERIIVTFNIKLNMAPIHVKCVMCQNRPFNLAYMGLHGDSYYDSLTAILTFLVNIALWRILIYRETRSCLIYRSIPIEVQYYHLMNADSESWAWIFQYNWPLLHTWALIPR